MVSQQWIFPHYHSCLAEKNTQSGKWIQTHSLLILLITQHKGQQRPGMEEVGFMSCDYCAERKWKALRVLLRGCEQILMLPSTFHRVNFYTWTFKVMIFSLVSKLPLSCHPTFCYVLAQWTWTEVSHDIWSVTVSPLFLFRNEITLVTL